MEGAGHADVRHIGRPLRENLIVRCLHMRMRPDHGHDLAVQIMPHRHFFRCGLCMHIYNHGSHSLLQSGQLFFGNLKRAIQRRHIGSPHQLHDAELLPTRRFDHHTAIPRRTARIIGRPKEARLTGEIVENFLLIPGMVSCRNDGKTHVEQLFRQLRRDAKPGGRVFTVPNNNINLPLSDQSGNGSGHRTAPGLSKDIADEENLHLAYSTYRLSRMTVTRIVPG